jgi:outer membrane protein assembly factor BamB
VEVLPWLLAGFGALAGFLLGSAASRRRWGPFLWPARLLALAALVALGFLAWPRLYWRMHPEGTRLTPGASLPVLETLGPVPPNGPPGPARPLRPGPWSEAWAQKPPRRPLSSPVRAGGLLLVGTWEGTVDAYSAATGAPVWSLKKKEPVYALAAVAGDLLLVGEGLHTSTTASVTAARLPGGQPLWQREFRGHIEAAPAFSAEQNKIWLGTGPGGLWCLDARDGTVVWHAGVGHVDTTPLLAGELVLFTSQPDEGRDESVFWALRARDGAVAWRIPLPGQPWGSPLLDPGTGLVLLSTGIGQIGVNLPTDRGWGHAVSLASRRLAWTTELGGNPIETSRLVPRAGLVAYVLTKGEVLALRASDGAPVWRFPLRSTTQAALASNGGQLAAVAFDGAVTFLDGATGKPLARRTLDAGSSSAPLFLHDGALLVSPYSLQRLRW